MIDVQACDILTGLTGLLLASSLVLAVAGLSGWIGMAITHRRLKRTARAAIEGQDAFWADFNDRLMVMRRPPSLRGGRGRRMSDRGLSAAQINEIREAYCDANMKCAGCEARQTAARAWLTVTGVGLLLDDNRRLLALNAAVATENGRLRDAGDELAGCAEALCLHYRRHTRHRCEIDRDAGLAVIHYRAMLADQQPPADDGAGEG
jgi:hypothetical protein